MGSDARRDGRRRSIDRGATLSETLVVIVVLGVLAVAVVVVVGRLRHEAVTSSCVTQRAALERATLVWRQRSDDPPTIDALVEAGIIRAGGDGYELSPDGDPVARADGPCGSASSPEAAAPSSEGGASTAPQESDAAAPDATTPGRPAGRNSPSDVIDSESDATEGVPPLEITLSWTGNADLDLWVRTPSGELVGWSRPGSDGAQLLADVVPPSPDAVGPHLERIVWPAESPPRGELHAVASFRTTGWGPQTSTGFVLAVRRGEEVIDSLAGPIADAGTQSTPLVARVGT